MRPVTAKHRSDKLIVSKKVTSAVVLRNKEQKKCIEQIEQKLEAEIAEKK